MYIQLHEEGEELVADESIVNRKLPTVALT